MNVLGIESSCDETAASVVDASGVRSDVIHTQAIHGEYGGVVPELAARAHTEKIVAVVRAALDRAGIQRPDAVAATAGPASATGAGSGSARGSGGSERCFDGAAISASSSGVGDVGAGADWPAQAS